MFPKSRPQARTTGQSLIELVVGLLALIPIVLAILDLAVIVIAVQMNDSTCREAARVAASGPPDTQDIQQRSGAIIARANQRGIGMMSNFQLISATSTASSSYLNGPQINNGQTFGGPVNGTVTVVTEVDVRPFIVQWCYSGVTPLRFRSSQTFPITYVIPNTVGSVSSGGGGTGSGGGGAGSTGGIGP
jgi:hypothetical protein